MGALDGKVAVITGGTAGLGLAAAQRFVAEGAFVFVTGRREAELAAAVAALGPNAEGVRGDSANLDDIDRLVDAVRAAGRTVDVLFANAGGGQMAPMGAITPQMVDECFDLNVRGVLFTVQKMLPLLVDGASIVLTGSAVSVQGIPAFSVYGAAKAALRHFARAWTMDLRERRIRVNLVSPGPTMTPGLTALVPPEGRNAFVHGLTATIPLGRVGAAEDVANAVLFLASDASSFVTGIELFVDGGSAQV